MVVARDTALPYPLPRGLQDTEPEPEPEPDPTVTVTVAQLAEATGAPTGVAERLLPVATRKVVDYAPQAPTEMLNEAVIRFAGYLVESGFGATRSRTVGSLSLESVVNHSTAFRNSGAAMLLTYHKVRRAGSIG